jgi:catechol 2,3-dioxygenase-like lactoylglutathione lyase family enzyme
MRRQWAPGEEQGERDFPKVTRRRSTPTTVRRPAEPTGVGPGPYRWDMTIQRMDNVGIVVDDLDAAVAFFTELGMELEGRMPIEESWAGNVVGLDDMRSEIAMMRIRDAPGRLELAKYHTPKAITPKPEIAPANTLGLHRVMFAVDDIEGTLARLRPHGAELVGEVTRYEDSYLLCYLRGPSGIILALAEQLS